MTSNSSDCHQQRLNSIPPFHHPGITTGTKNITYKIHDKVVSGSPDRIEVIQPSLKDKEVIERRFNEAFEPAIVNGDGIIGHRQVQEEDPADQPSSNHQTGEQCDDFGLEAELLKEKAKVEVCQEISFQADNEEAIPAQRKVQELTSNSSDCHQQRLNSIPPFHHPCITTGTKNITYKIRDKVVSGSPDRIEVIQPSLKDKEVIERRFNEAFEPAIVNGDGIIGHRQVQEEDLADQPSSNHQTGEQCDDFGLEAELLKEKAKVEVCQEIFFQADNEEAIPAQRKVQEVTSNSSDCHQQRLNSIPPFHHPCITTGTKNITYKIRDKVVSGSPDRIEVIQPSLKDKEVIERRFNKAFEPAIVNGDGIIGHRQVQEEDLADQPSSNHQTGEQCDDFGLEAELLKEKAKVEVCQEISFQADNEEAIPARKKVWEVTAGSGDSHQQQFDSNLTDHYLGEMTETKNIVRHIVDEIVSGVPDRIKMNQPNLKDTEAIERCFNETFEPAMVSRNQIIGHRHVHEEDPIQPPARDHLIGAEEHIDDLEHEIVNLQECLEVAEAHVDKMEAELLKEKAKVEVIEKELNSREALLMLTLKEKDQELERAEKRTAKAEKAAYEGYLNHQDAVEMFQVTIKQKEHELHEKEESNHMLRKEMMEIMNRFASEKQQIEHNLNQVRQNQENSSRTKFLEEELDKLQKKLALKTNENKMLHKEVKSLKSKVAMQVSINDRAERIARILDAIDSID